MSSIQIIKVTDIGLTAESPMRLMTGTLIEWEEPIEEEATEEKLTPKQALDAYYLKEDSPEEESPPEPPPEVIPEVTPIPKVVGEVELDEEGRIKQKVIEQEATEEEVRQEVEPIPEDPDRVEVESVVEPGEEEGEDKEVDEVLFPDMGAIGHTMCFKRVVRHDHKPITFQKVENRSSDWKRLWGSYPNLRKMVMGII